MATVKQKNSENAEVYAERLADIGKDYFGKNLSNDLIQRQLVRYFSTGLHPNETNEGNPDQLDS